MREWELSREQLPSVILAADARLCTPNYVDDQIWELSLASGEPPALTLRTTYGLRARSMRLFPRFVEGDLSVSDPAQFSAPPVFHRLYPNYALLTCSPFAGLDVVLEYWVFSSYKVGGRIRLINNGVTTRPIRMEWTAVLSAAGDGGRPLTPEKFAGVNVLAGRAGNLAPVVFLSGGAEAQSSPTTALTVAADLLPDARKVFLWGHAAAEDEGQSFEDARAFAGLKWDEEIGHLTMTNAARLDIETGDAGWDLAFALGQSTALQLLHGPTPHLPHRSFVHTRLPDQGYSLRGDGSDYDHLWNGQNVLETWHLCSQLLPSDPETALGLLENFLATQDADGCIDWQPSLNGKLSGVLATPMLCSLAWRIYRLTGDRVWLVKNFPRFQKFMQHWFSPEHDRDGDGVPEWDHPMQTGYEDNPFFAHWQDWAQGADIVDFESPSLTALLHRECESLIRIAMEINYTAAIPAVEEKRFRLQRSLDTAWDAAAGVFRYRDRNTDASPAGQVLTRQRGPGLFLLTDRTFQPEARLSIRIRRVTEGLRDPVITVNGSNSSGEDLEETLAGDGVRWTLTWGTAVSEFVYHRVARVKIEGIQPEDDVVIQTLDYRHLDQTLLAPLWAGTANEEQAGLLIRQTILEPSRFWRPFGLAACATRPAPEAEIECESVWIPWSCMVGEGLVRYGFVAEAADLVTHMMGGIVENLRRSGAFRKHLHGQTGAGIGERNAVLGLPPLDLFLKTLGVSIQSVWRVHLSGRNPFPWPVTLRMRGLTIRRGLEQTEITFPNGESVTVTSDEPCVVDGR